MMNVNEVLKAARDVIDEPSKWCVGCRGINGQHCALGALEVAIYGAGEGKVDYIEHSGVGMAAVRCLADLTDSDGRDSSVSKVAGFNNSRNHACVLEWFDAAIEVSAKS